MVRVDFMFVDSTTDFILVRYNDFGFIDLLVTKTESRFNQDTLEYLSSIEHLLFQSASCESPAVTSDLETRLTGDIDPPSARFTPWPQKADIRGLLRGLSESETAIQ